MTLASARHRGFTLIELLVTLAVAAILSTLAIPSGLEMVRNAQVRGAANDLMGHVLRARSEAMTRQAMVSLCPTDDGESCGDVGDFSAGLVSFEGADDELDADADLISFKDIGQQMVSYTGSSAISFDARGFAVTAVAIGIQRGNDDRFVRRLCVDLPGRVEIVVGEVCPHEA